MEALAAFSIPQVLTLAAQALTFAWTQYNNIQGYEEQCRLMIQRCQDLLIAVSKEVHAAGNERVRSMTNQLRALETTCVTVKDTVARLAKKSFMWKLLHQDKIVQSLSAAENAVVDVFEVFNLGAHLSAQRLQLEIADVRSKDQAKLVAHLESLAENDQKILNALQADARGRRRLEELIIALTKHVSAVGENSTKTSQDATEKFIRIAFDSLKRLSKKPVTGIQHWSVTSLEVTFDPDDEDNCIGMGGFGNIYKGEWNGEVVAVKEMYSEDARLLDRDKLKYIEREIKIWSRLVHPRILPFYCACLEATRPFMVTKFCKNGNVLQHLRSHPDANRTRILHEVCLGMVYLHNQNVIHADLKGSNILIGDGGNALITDFGLSHLQDQVATTASRTRASTHRMAGTLRWMAPELLDGESLGKPCDVYSFGLLSWELYTGRVPYGEIPERAVTRRIVDKQERPSRPERMGNDLWAITELCWAHDPISRPAFSTLQVHFKALIPPDLLQLSSPSALASSGTSFSSPQSVSSEPPSKLFESLTFLDSSGTSSWTQDFVDSHTLLTNTQYKPTLQTLPANEPHFSRSRVASVMERHRADSAPQHQSAGLLPPQRSPNTLPELNRHPHYLQSVQVLPTNPPPPPPHPTELQAARIHYTNPSLEGRIAVHIPENPRPGAIAYSHSTKTPNLDHKTRQAPQTPQVPMATTERYPAPLVHPSEMVVLAPPTRRYALNELLGYHVDLLNGAASKDITSVAIDDDWVVVGFANSWIVVFDATTGDYVRHLIGHTSGVWSVMIISRGGFSDLPRSRFPCSSSSGWNQPYSLLLSGGQDNILRVWNLQSGACLHALNGHSRTIRCLAAVDGSPVVLTGSRDHTIRTWDAENGYALKILSGHRDGIQSLKVHKNIAVSASADTTLRIWDIYKGSCLHTLCAHTNRVRTIDFNGTLIVSGGDDGMIRVWDVYSGKCTDSVKHFRSMVGNITLSDGLIVASNMDGLVCVYDIQTQQIIDVIPAHRGHIPSLYIDLPYLITGSSDGSIKRWNAETCALVDHLGADGPRIMCPWRFARWRDTWVVAREVDEKACIEIWR
ncbi:hypothetical protein HGRIS_005255 [Hohenbuehelia grisea]|uniref:Protein kinase domain-containing protein n=1 Tax=Hohenbuehelia grisea TaxID=104357 RepID=A0ABR3JEH1_9AGAR